MDSFGISVIPVHAHRREHWRIVLVTLRTAALIVGRRPNA